MRFVFVLTHLVLLLMSLTFPTYPLVELIVVFVSVMAFVKVKAYFVDGSHNSNHCENNRHPQNEIHFPFLSVYRFALNLLRFFLHGPVVLDNLLNYCTKYHRN